MARNTSIIPKAPCGRILQIAGAPRVSEEAMDVFSNIIEEFAEEIASRAVKIAKHSGRKTVLAGDIKVAVK
ncbi:MAG: histone family protein [Nanoarchaeota archaeon]